MLQEICYNKYMLHEKCYNMLPVENNFFPMK